MSIRMVSFARMPPLIEGHADTTDHGRLALRGKQFRRLCEIEKELDKFHMTPEFDDSMLEALSIIRGSPFNIDDDDPIDLDQRFFLRGPVEDMEYGIDVTNEGEFTEYCRWPQFEPIDEDLRREEDQKYADAPHYARLNLYDSRLQSDVGEGATCAFFCERAAQVTSSWQHHRYIKESKKPAFYDIWFSRQTGQPFADYWHSGAYYRWHPGSDEMDDMHPSVPHAVATVYDSARPRSQGMLRSELRVAVYLLKEQIRQPSVYVKHCICPVLVISFHGQFSARITQAYFENDKVILRPSRLINIRTPDITSEVQLIIRWLISKPIGDTHSPTPESKQRDVLVSTPVGDTETRSTESLIVDDQ